MFFVKIMLESTSMQDYYAKFKRVKKERLIMIGTDILLYSCCMVFYARDYIFDDDQLDRKHPIQLGFFTILRILRIMIDLYIGFQMVLFILFFLKQQRKTMKAKGREISC